MAVSAYAAVLSLKHFLDGIQQYPPKHRLRWLSFLQDRIETLREKVNFFEDFLEIYSQRLYERLKDLGRQIAEFAFEAQVIIDTIVVDQLHDMDLSFSCEDVDDVIEIFDSIKKKLTMIKEEVPILEQGPEASVLARSSAPPLSGNSTVVGFDERLHQIMDKLGGYERDLQVLPIVGMGGIGKTTLAKTAFDNSYISRHFDKRVWLTISQEYNIQGILLALLKELGDQKIKESGENLAKLGEQLHKSLFQRRYLVVLDDVWSADAWDNIKSFFPDNKNGSRIMVTTRLLDVAVSFTSRNPYLMDFLDADKSWNLFCEKAFGKDGHCPPELEEVGRSIAKSCKGLPLAIVVIGGLLSKSKMTQEYWKSVAKDGYSFAQSVAKDDEHCLKILSLSYHHLPIHLKPCFLYMRVFPEDSEIYGPNLIRSWVVEGFLKPIKDKTLEEVAQEYLEDLIGRNLILISERTRGGKIRYCMIHDLLRDLCIRESHKEYFYRVPIEQKLDLFNLWDTDSYEPWDADLYKQWDTALFEPSDADLFEPWDAEHCKLCRQSKALTRIDLTRVVVASHLISPASCSVCDKCRNMYPQLNRLRWVKLLDPDGYSNEDIMHPTIIKMLDVSGDFKFIDNRMYLLWNLQCLSIKALELDMLPSEIWELPQLRDVYTESPIVLADPPLIAQVDRKDSTIILKNLQKLSFIKNFRWSNDAVERIPNLKTLAITYDQSDNRFIEWSSYSLQNLDRLLELKSLYLKAKELVTLKNMITFPNSLRKLTLDGCKIPWEEMTIIGSLPNLEELQLHDDAFRGPEWNPIEGEFLRLKLLMIDSTDLVCWGVEKCHFPNLEFLELKDMKCLEKVPSGIGEIMTLRSIRLRSCPESVLNSAKEILEEQYNYGNEDFQLYINDKRVFPSTN